MTYYTCVAAKASGYERLLEPPFRVIRHAPGYNVLVSFEEKGIAVLQEVLSTIAIGCRQGDDGSICRFILLWDDNLNGYELTESDMTASEWKQRPGWRRDGSREVHSRIRQNAKIECYRKRDTAVCAKLTQPTVRKGRISLLWFPLYRHFLYAKPGGDSQFRFRFRRVRGKKPMPLFIFLHGMGSMGYNGIVSMNEFTLTWPGLKKARQKCHVLVPQLGLSDPYAAELSEDLGAVIASLRRVDRSRIYLTGLSMGGCGAVIECRRHPGRYAACATSVAALRNLENPDENDEHKGPLDQQAFDTLVQTPLWLGYSRVEKNVNEPLFEALREREADVKYTFVKGFGHVLAGSVFWLTQPWAKWLFTHHL